MEISFFDKTHVAHNQDDIGADCTCGGILANINQIIAADDGRICLRFYKNLVTNLLIKLQHCSPLKLCDNVIFMITLWPLASSDNS